MDSAISTPPPNHAEPLRGAPSRFLKLPAELRLQIYELIFTDEAERHVHSIGLRTARPSWHLPLLTCRQVYNEASQIYRRAHRTYWSSHTFFLYMTTTCVLTHEYIAGLTEADLRHVKHSELIFVPNSAYLLDMIKIRMVDPCGLWKACYRVKGRIDVLPQGQRYLCWRETVDSDCDLLDPCQTAEPHDRPVEQGVPDYHPAPVSFPIRENLCDLGKAVEEGGYQ